MNIDKPLEYIINTGITTDNCEFIIQPRTERGWTLDFVFNREDLPWYSGSTFYYWGVKDEIRPEIYLDNNLSFAFTPEGEITWRSFRYSGYCGVSGYTGTSYVSSGTTTPFCTGGTSNDFNVTIVFKRYYNYTGCDIENEGGSNDLITGHTITNILPYVTGATPQYETVYALNDLWFEEREKRLGTLKIYLNGIKTYQIENWEEIIPTIRTTGSTIVQIWGGGTTGSGDIHTGVTFFNLKKIKYFEEPLDFVHIRHHYLSEIKPNYNIVECTTECQDIVTIYPPTPTPTITMTQTTTPTPTPTINTDELVLNFNSITGVPVNDISSVSDWNLFFDLPENGNPFTSVEVSGLRVNLRGGSNIHVKDILFLNNKSLTYLNDVMGLITSAGYGSFYGCSSVVSYNFNGLISAGTICFRVNNSCPNCETTIFNAPLLQFAGNNCFYGLENISTYNLMSLAYSGELCFYNWKIKTFNFPSLEIIGNNCFDGCVSGQTFNFPVCTDLGNTVGNDNVFLNIVGNNINLLIPSELMTINAGNPDGDIEYLMSNNTVTIIQV